MNIYILGRTSRPQNIYTIEHQVAAFGLGSFPKYPVLVWYCEHVLVCNCVHVDLGGFFWFDYTV